MDPEFNLVEPYWLNMQCKIRICLHERECSSRQSFSVQPFSFIQFNVSGQKIHMTPCI